MEAWKPLCSFTRRLILTKRKKRLQLIGLAAIVITIILIRSDITTWIFSYIYPPAEVKLATTLLPLTALASFPGSGNTWLRHLVQEATGIGTGSLYCDPALRYTSFPFECIRNESVILVKTHHPLGFRGLEFKRMVLLLRNPFDAFRAQFNRLHSNGLEHTGFAAEGEIERRCEIVCKEILSQLIRVLFWFFERT